MSKESYWREQVERQRASGLFISAYCRKEQISSASFDYWKSKLKQRPSGFVTVAPVASFTPVTIELRNGSIIRIPDVETPFRGENCPKIGNRSDGSSVERGSDFVMSIAGVGLFAIDMCY